MITPFIVVFKGRVYKFVTYSAARDCYLDFVDQVKEYYQVTNSHRHPLAIDKYVKLICL